MWYLLTLYLLLFPNLFALARARPLLTIFLVCIALLLLSLASAGSSSGGSGYSSSSYTSSMHDVRSDAQTRTRDASNDYLRKVRDTTRR